MPSPVIQQEMKKTRVESPIPASQPRGEVDDAAPENLRMQLESLLETASPDAVAAKDPYTMVDLISPEREDLQGPQHCLIN